MRLILLSFAFMAWAFYELSGGADFDPEAVREARMAELEMDAPEPYVAPAKVAVIEEAPKVVVDTDPPSRDTATRISLNLTTLEDTDATVGATQTAEAPTQTDVAAAVETALEAVPQNVPVVTSSADTPAIIPSLIDPDDGAAQTAENQPTAVSFADVRTVSGTRVNVRGGPGTDFGVVGRLTQGDEIVVLEDNGAGWVRFETQDGTTAGWMADFLLTNS